MLPRGLCLVCFADADASCLPPQLDAIVAAIPASGTSLAQLARACAGPPSAFSAAVAAAMLALRVQLPGDQLVFMLAVAALQRSPAWAQVAAGDA